MPLTRAPKADADTRVPLPPAPRRTPLLEASTGLVTRAWATWFDLLWKRGGEAHAPSNAELDEGLGGNQDALAALQVELDATQAELAATQADLEGTQAQLTATQAELDTTQAALAQAQADITAVEAAQGATQAELDTTQAALASDLPPGTAFAVPRYQSDGVGLEASSASVSATGTLTVTGALSVGDAATSRTNLGLGTASDVQFARAGLGVTTTGIARLTMAALVEPKLLLYGEAVNARYGISVVAGALRLHTTSAARLSLGNMSTTDGTTYTEHLGIHAPGGHVFLGAPASAPADAQMLNNQVCVWVNGSTLTFRVKNSAGTMQTATLALS